MQQSHPIREGLRPGEMVVRFPLASRNPFRSGKVFGQPPAGILSAVSGLHRPPPDFRLRPPERGLRRAAIPGLPSAAADRISRPGMPDQVAGWMTSSVVHAFHARFPVCADYLVRIPQCPSAHTCPARAVTNRHVWVSIASPLPASAAADTGCRDPGGRSPCGQEPRRPSGTTA